MASGAAVGQPQIACGAAAARNVHGATADQSGVGNRCPVEDGRRALVDQPEVVC